MSDRNSRNDDLQDYLDLLDAYSKKSKNGYKILRDQEDRKLNGLEDTSNEYDGGYADSEEDAEDILTIGDEEETNYSFYEDDIPSVPKRSNPPATKEKNPFKRLANWYNNLPKKKKIVVSIIAIILVLIIVLTSVLGIFLYSKFTLITDGTEIQQDDQIYQDPELEDIEIDIGSAGFKQALMDWATTGNDKHMYSKNVINVLLIGADSRNGTNTGNTDVMMLLSVNKKTKKITIASFLRDSYLYIQGKNSDYCTKLNAAFSMGGAECLMQTIENNYKIKIDNYAMVNFKTFATIIDEMGGVEVPEIEQFESDYNVKKHGIPLPVGENVTLNGDEALCFVRNRSCYGEGDLRRAKNQRVVIDQIMNKLKDASVSDLNKYINILLPQVMTGYTEGEIISLGTKAIMGGWVGYERTQMQVPSDENCQQGSADMWIWVVDYQQAAHDLQMQLYGQSNITIEDGRTTLIDVYNGANYDDSSDDDDIGENTADDDDSSYEDDNSYDVTEQETQSQGSEDNENSSQDDTTTSATDNNQETTSTDDTSNTEDSGGENTGEDDSGNGDVAGDEGGSSEDNNVGGDVIQDPIEVPTDGGEASPVGEEQ